METSTVDTHPNETKSIETSGSIPVTESDVVLEMDDLGALELDDDENEMITRGVD